MNACTYAISMLTDYSRLAEIHRLTHDTLIEAGDIMPREDQKVAFYPHLDRSKNTTILVAERMGKIIGTNSLTRDGAEGLNTDLLFKTETDEIRRTVTQPHRLGSSWRIATSREFRSERTLVLDLLRNTILRALDLEIDVCLMVFNERHVSVYKRLLTAEVVAQRPTSLDGNIGVNVALMKLNVKTAWNRFKTIVRA